MHTGRVFKGAGSFELVEISQAQTLFNWSETIETSRIKFLLIAPFLWLGVRISLARLSTTLR
jgi:flagellar assembly factor FliW